MATLVARIARTTRSFVLITIAIFLVGACSNNKSGSLPDKKLSRADSRTPNPVPKDRTAIRGQLDRYLGQTSEDGFLNSTYHSAIRFGDRWPTAERVVATAVGGQRAIQESDIFKVGKKGQKLLFLLNNYRGLQVVSYAAGEDKPELVGRVEASGNYPQDMYYFEDTELLLVLERNYYDETGENPHYRARNSRILAYDVSNPKSPTLLRAPLAVVGEIADSRLVGNVLYVATSEYPDWYQRNSDVKPTGNIFAYRLDDDGVTAAASMKLSLPVVSRENMNIVEVLNSDGSYKYYLVAVLSENRWSWWDRKNLVEVVDISDPNGKMDSIMLVNARGMIRERSTFIRDNTLIIASNYQHDPDSKWRIALETFKFPSAETEPISEAELRFLKMRIRQLYKAAEKGLRKTLKGDALQDELDGLYKALFEKKFEVISETGEQREVALKGSFVRLSGRSDGQEDETIDGAVDTSAPVKIAGKLQKVVADSGDTRGDTRGDHATLQDTRVSGDYLFAFWVPRSNMDPLEIYSIKDPQNGVKHLRHHEFDGWVERSDAIEFNKHMYIVGLGWVTPSGDERSRMVPQAVLFEITQRGDKVSVETVTEAKLAGSNVSINFNEPDKFIEFKWNLSEDKQFTGAGTVLFKIDSWGQDSTRGAKMLGIDLTKVESGGEVFTVGASLAGNPGWLRRVFRNPELKLINTFSDRALLTFKDLGAQTAEELAQAIRILELARNIEAYVTIGKPGSERGIQIVKNYGYESGNAHDDVSLRLVPLRAADAELQSVRNGQWVERPHVTLENESLQDHLVAADGSLLLFTSYLSYDQEHPLRNKQRYSVFKVRLSGDRKNLEVVGKVVWHQKQTDQLYFDFEFGNGLIQVGNQVLAGSGNELRLVEQGGALTGGEETEPLLVDTKECLQKHASVSLQVIDGRLFLTSSRMEREKKDGTLEVIDIDKPTDPAEDSKSRRLFQRHFLASAELAGNALKCGKTVNVPGRPVMVGRAGSLLVTEDQRLLSTVKVKRGNDTIEQSVIEPVLVSLHWDREKNVVTLRDMFDPAGAGTSAYAMKVVDGDSFVFFENRSQSFDWFDGPGFERASMIRRPGPWTSRTTASELVRLTFSDNLTFEQRSMGVQLGLGGSVRLAAIFNDVSTESHLAVATSGRKAQVIAWDNKTLEPKVLKVSVLDSKFRRQKPTETFTLNNHWGYYYGEKGIHLTQLPKGQKSLEFSEGIFGIKQVLVE